MPKPELKQTKQLELLIDRMSILLVVCKSRSESWDVWIREGMYEDADGMGEELRQWPDYKTARNIIVEMLRRSDNETTKENGVLGGYENHAEQRGTIRNGE